MIAVGDGQPLLAGGARRGGKAQTDAYVAVARFIEAQKQLRPAGAP